MEKYLNKDISVIDFDIRKPDFDITKLGVLNYKFNKNNIELFLNNVDSDEKVREIMKKFLDITIHVSYETFTKKIKENLVQVLKDNYKPGINIFAYISEDSKSSEIKSSFWIYKYIEYFLKDLEISVIIIKTLNDEKVNDDDIILVPDDCIYTGEQMKRNISSFLEKGTKKKVKIILFAPYISKSGLNIIKDIFNNNNLLGTCEFIIGNHIIIKPLIDYLTENEILILQSKFSEFDNLASKRYAIYFDHKLPDYLSGFPEFYSGKVDRRIFYPLFKYCNKYNYNINIYNGKSIYEPNNANGCPFSPYKKNYIKNLSDNNLLLEKFYYLKEEPIKKEEISTTKKKLKLQKQSELEEKRLELQEKIQELKIQINLLKNLLEDYNKKNK